LNPDGSPLSFFFFAVLRNKRYHNIIIRNEKKEKACLNLLFQFSIVCLAWYEISEFYNSKLIVAIVREVRYNRVTASFDSLTNVFYMPFEHHLIFL